MTAVITVQLQRIAESDVTVSYKTEDGSAKAGKDYIGMVGSMVITKGSRSATVNLRVKSNTVYQDNRDFVFSIDAVSGGNAQKGSTTSARIQIEDDDPEPIVSFKNAKTMVSEAAGTFSVPIVSDRLSEKPTNVKLTLGGLAVRDVDYRIDKLDYVIPPMATGVDVNVTILADKLVEGTEDLQLTIAGVQNGKAGGNVSSVFISGDLKLPDTGYTKFYNNGQYQSNSPGSAHPYQDANYGLDTDPLYANNGYGGMLLQKIDNDGNPMRNDVVNHSCVTDNHTGLSWEIRTEINERQWSDLKGAALWGSANWRSKANTYLWYSRDSKNNGGQMGGTNSKEWSDNVYVSEHCSFPDKDNPLFASASEGCTTKQYIETVNRAGLCGFSDWRLPSMMELNTIVVYESQKGLLDESYFIDENYQFLNGDSQVRYLSSTPSVDNDASVWCLNATTKSAELCNKTSYNYVKLVRGPKL